MADTQGAASSALDRLRVNTPSSAYTYIQVHLNVDLIVVVVVYMLYICKEREGLLGRLHVCSKCKGRDGNLSVVVLPTVQNDSEGLTTPPRSFCR